MLISSRWSPSVAARSSLAYQGTVRLGASKKTSEPNINRCHFEEVPSVSSPITSCHLQKNRGDIEQGDSTTLRHGGWTAQLHSSTNTNFFFTQGHNIRQPNRERVVAYNKGNGEQYEPVNIAVIFIHIVLLTDIINVYWSRPENHTLRLMLLQDCFSSLICLFSAGEDVHAAENLHSSKMSSFTFFHSVPRRYFQTFKVLLDIFHLAATEHGITLAFVFTFKTMEAATLTHCTTRRNGTYTIMVWISSSTYEDIKINTELIPVGRFS